MICVHCYCNVQHIATPNGSPKRHGYKFMKDFEFYSLPSCFEQTTKFEIDESESGRRNLEFFARKLHVLRFYMFHVESIALALYCSSKDIWPRDSGRILRINRTNIPALCPIDTYSHQDRLLLKIAAILWTIRAFYLFFRQSRHCGFIENWQQFHRELRTIYSTHAHIVKGRGWTKN